MGWQRLPHIFWSAVLQIQTCWQNAVLLPPIACHLRASPTKSVMPNRWHFPITFLFNKHCSFPSTDHGWHAFHVLLYSPYHSLSCIPPSPVMMTVCQRSVGDSEIQSPNWSRNFLADKAYRFGSQKIKEKIVQLSRRDQRARCLRCSDGPGERFERRMGSLTNWVCVLEVVERWFGASCWMPALLTHWRPWKQMVSFNTFRRMELFSMAYFLSLCALMDAPI